MLWIVIATLVLLITVAAFLVRSHRAASQAMLAAPFVVHVEAGKKTAYPADSMDQAMALANTLQELHGSEASITIEER